jgi:hypothetical protein
MSFDPYAGSPYTTLEELLMNAFVAAVALLTTSINPQDLYNALSAANDQMDLPPTCEYLIQQDSAGKSFSLTVYEQAIPGVDYNGNSFSVTVDHDVDVSSLSDGKTLYRYTENVPPEHGANRGVFEIESDSGRVSTVTMYQEEYPGDGWSNSVLQVSCY